MTRPDLSTRWLGMDLPNPLVASSSPLTGDLGSLAALEQAGVAAVVLPSLFQEQLEHDELQLGTLHDTGAESFPEASHYFFDPRAYTAYNTGPEGYLDLVRRAREALSIPVVASLNGVSRRGWARHAQRVEEAGASAIELNLLVVPTDPATSAADVEQRLGDELAAVRAAVQVPLEVKLGNCFTAPAHIVQRLVQAGADGIALFNRFPEPDIDLERMDVVPHLELSRPAELGSSLRWIALLRPHVRCSLAATTGVHSAEDAVKLLLAGADVVMSASALLRHGPAWARTLLDGLAAWLEQHEAISVEQVKGSMSHAHCPNPAGYERLNYMRALISYGTAFGTPGAR